MGRAPWTWTPGSGATIARLYGMLLALISLVAWLSLGVQVRRLVGSHGLLPLGDFIDAAREAGLARWTRLPTIFLWTQSDGALVAGIVAGVALSLAALAGVQRRLCFALSTVLYLSYATACRVFLSFQWDNLLLECGLLAAFLPAHRAAPVAHFLLRALLFKLYFESGLAKWQSPLRDWHDGSAMTYYYETAPLPTALAYYAHHLPLWWHHVESRATLVFELVLPFAIFGPRRARLAAAAGLTLFQIFNLATANYGFFCYLALALHVFLLDERDVARIARFLLPRDGAAQAPPRADAAEEAAGDVRRIFAGVGVAAYLALSVAQASLHFTEGEPGRLLTALATAVNGADAFRLVNTYHLFASITRERIEPELQTLSADASGQRNDADVKDDGAWTAHDLRHKPGALTRRPDFVAPHQPRLDFQLWFHGLGFRHGAPTYVQVLLERMCEDAAAVRPFFSDEPRDRLPEHPLAVRIVYWQYHFTSMAEKRATGAWWRRERLAATRPVVCAP